MRFYAGPSSSSLAAKRCTSPKSGADTKFNADEFEDVIAETQLIPDGCGVKSIPNHDPRMRILLLPPSYTHE